MVEFLNRIGISVCAGRFSEPAFLPGILVAQGALIIDEPSLRYPGDLLHEAGHIAVAAPSRRPHLGANVGGDAGEEMMAIGWSYAAAIHLGLDPAVVFHPDGYRGGSASLLENFSEGRYIGVPLLQWIGLTAEPGPAAALGIPPYPHMRKWIRDVEDPSAPAAGVD